MIPEELRRRQLAAVEVADAAKRDDGPKPYLDIALARARLQVTAWLVLVALAAAEVAILLGGSLGVVLHGVLTPVLLIAGGKVTSRRLRVLLWALAVIPTSRLVAFGAPLGELAGEARVGLVGALTLLATVIAVRATGLTRGDLGLTARWRQLPLYLAMVPVGLGLGVVERALVPVAVLPGIADDLGLATVMAQGLVDDLLIFGLLLGAARLVMGRLGAVYVALLLAVLHLAYGAPPLVASALVVGLVFGWARMGSSSLLAVALGHLALNVGIFVFGPDLAPGLPSLLAPLASAVGLDLNGLFGPPGPGLGPGRR